MELRTYNRNVVSSSEQLQTSNNEKNCLNGEFTFGVIGYGNFGRAFAVRLDSCGLNFMVGTRDVSKRMEQSFGLSVNYFTSYELAVESSHVIILAIPYSAYDDVVKPLANLLENKIVVDVSNAEKNTDLCHAEYLSELLPSSHVVKAFNTISAWAMEQDIYGASRNTFVCSNDVTARSTVMQLAQEMGFTPVERGRLKSANVLEKQPLQLFPEWRLAFWISFFMLLFQIFYICIKYYTYGITASKALSYIGLNLPMVLTGWMTLWLLAITFLPGCIAGFVQLTRGTKYSMFPRWLDRWMKARKQLGLFALMFGSVHACLAIIMLAGTYFYKFTYAKRIPSTNLYIYHRYLIYFEFSLLFATISIALLVILGLTSLPSVNQTMSWREWDFVQSKLGYASMLFGFLHVLAFAAKAFSIEVIKKYWIYGLPVSVFLMMLLPMIVLGLKIILIMPGINGLLMKIRSGWERGSSRSHDYVEI